MRWTVRANTLIKSTPIWITATVLALKTSSVSLIKLKNIIVLMKTNNKLLINNIWTSLQKVKSMYIRIGILVIFRIKSRIMRRPPRYPVAEGLTQARPAGLQSQRRSLVKVNLWIRLLYLKTRMRALISFRP